MNVVQEVVAESPKREEIRSQTLSLLMAARSFFQFNYPSAVEHCKTWDEKFYIRRENQHITNFLSNIILWLSDKTGDQSEQPGNHRDGENSGLFANPPFYHPERTDLDHLLPSEFISIRNRVEQFNGRLNGLMNMSG